MEVKISSVTISRIKVPEFIFSEILNYVDGHLIIKYEELPGPLVTLPHGMIQEA